MPFDSINNDIENQASSVDLMINDKEPQATSFDSEIEIVECEDDSDDVLLAKSSDKFWNYYYDLNRFDILEKARPDWLSGRVKTKPVELIEKIASNPALANYCREKEYYFLLRVANPTWHETFFDESSSEFLHQLAITPKLRHYYYLINRFSVLEKMNPHWYEEYFKVDSPQFMERLVKNKFLWDYCRQINRHDILDLATPTWDDDNFPITPETLLNFAAFCSVTFAVVMFWKTVFDDENDNNQFRFFPSAAGLFLATTFHLTTHFIRCLVACNEPKSDSAPEFPITIYVEPSEPIELQTPVSANLSNSISKFFICCLKSISDPQNKKLLMEDALTAEELKPLTSTNMKNK